LNRRIIDFTELKAYCDIFNENGHKGFKEAINPFFWWNHEIPGKIDDAVHAFIDSGLVIVLELEKMGSKDVKNLLIFALCPQKNILRKIVDICKNYDIINYHTEFNRNRYKNISRRFDGSSQFQGGKYYYSAKGRNAWNLSNPLL